MLQGKLDEAGITLDDADAMFEKYGDNLRVRCEDLTVRISLARLNGENNRVSGNQTHLRSLLKNSSPANFFNFPFLVEEQKRLLTA